jgi:hypothetical protein
MILKGNMNFTGINELNLDTRPPERAYKGLIGADS